MRNTLCVLTALLLAAATTAAHAKPIVWTLNDVSYISSGTLSLDGSFVYNANTNVFSDVHLVLDGIVSNNASIRSGSANEIVFTISSGASGYVDFASPLTDAGGTVLVLGGLYNIYYPLNLGGSLTGVALTPEPSSLALLGTGLIGVVGILRKRLR